MSTISNLEAVLLGLLAEKPMHPYEIEKNVVERDMRGWTEISLSSIYKVLGKLEKKLLVNVHRELTEANVAKKVYMITDSGRKEVKEKVRELLSEMQVVIYPVDLGLHNLHLLDRDEVQVVIPQYIQSINQQLACFVALEGYLKSEQCPVHRIALAKRRQYLLTAERDWARNFLEEYNHAPTS